MPWLYNLAVRRGLRDENYAANSKHVEYHEHFNLTQICELAGKSFQLEKVRRAGLFIFPLMDWLSWPFYRTNRHMHPVRLFFQKLAGWDYLIDYGVLSYGIFCSFRKPEIADDIGGLY